MYSSGVRHSSTLPHFFCVCVKIFFNGSNVALLSACPDEWEFKMKKNIHMTISDINIDYNITCIKLLVCGHRVNRILQYIIHFTFCITPWSLLGNRSSALRDFCHSLYNMKKIIPSSNQNSKKCQNLTCAQNTMLTQGIQKVSVKDTDSGHT